MRRVATPISPLAEATVLAGCWLAVYLLLARRDFGGDDLIYAISIEKVLAGFGFDREFCHPHHPVLNPLVAGVVALLRLFSSVGVIETGAAVSAMLGAGVVGGLVLLLRRAGRDELSAALGASLAGALAGFWSFATIHEVYMLEALAVLVWLAAASRPQPRALAVGAALAGAIVAHLACVCLVPGTLFALRRRPRVAVVSSALAGAAAGAVYLAVLLTCHGVRSVPDAVRAMRPEARYVAAQPALAAFGALKRLIVTDWYSRVPVLAPQATAVLVQAGRIALALGIALLVLGVWQAVRRRDALGLAAVSGLAGFLPLWFLFDTGNTEHMIATVPFLAVMTVVAGSPLPRRVTAAAAVALLTLLVVTNGIGSALLRSRKENSRLMVIADAVAAGLPVGSVILAAGGEPLIRLGLPYLSGRRVVDLAVVLQQARGEGRGPDEAVAAWLRSAAGGGPVWVTQEVLGPGSAIWAAEQGIAPETWRRASSAFVPQRRLQVAADGAVLVTPFVLTEVALLVERQ